MPLPAVPAAETAAQRAARDFQTKALAASDANHEAGTARYARNIGGQFSTRKARLYATVTGTVATGLDGATVDLTVLRAG